MKTELLKQNAVLFPVEQLESNALTILAQIANPKPTFTPE